MKKFDPEVDTPLLLARACALGAGDAGVAALGELDATPLREWLERGYGAGMDYLRKHLPLRDHPEAILPGARTALIIALPYAGHTPGETPDDGIAHYARGGDYHTVIGDILWELIGEITTTYAGAECRAFVDATPLPERELARRAGLGWVGRHSLLIHPQFGSRFVIGGILTNLPLLPATLLESGDCGTCNRCRASCPTGALGNGVVDARRCLSYLTIEHKGAIPEEIRPLQGSRLFGCDSCQDACPHNATTAPGSPGLAASAVITELPELLKLTSEEFKERYRHTALYRTKRTGLLRNACVALGNLGNEAHLPALQGALQDEDPIIREHAEWAIERIIELCGFVDEEE